MAICLEGYSSHCSLMERHRALVAACDILRSERRALLSDVREEGGLTAVPAAHSSRTPSLPERVAGPLPHTPVSTQEWHAGNLLGERSG